MPSEVEELIGFLTSPKLEVRKAAVEIALGLSGSDEGIQQLSTLAEDVTKPLLRLLGDRQEIAKQVAATLVNLSQDPRIADAAVRGAGVERAMEGVQEGECRHKGLLIMLLANLTQTDEGSRKMLQLDNFALQGLHIVRLLRSYAAGAEVGEDEFEHVGTVLVNVTQLKEGRKLLLDPKRRLLVHVLSQAQSSSVQRRQAVVNVLRNCCFEVAHEMASLLLLSDALWPALLLPLAGTKAYLSEDTSKMPECLAKPLSSKRDREGSQAVRLAAAEACLLVAHQDEGRQALWEVNAPRIVQRGYEEEEDPEVIEVVERLGALFLANNRSEDTTEEVGLDSQEGGPSDKGQPAGSWAST